MSSLSAADLCSRIAIGFKVRVPLPRGRVSVFLAAPIVALLFTATLCAADAPSQAASTDKPRVAGIQIGIEGAYKLGRWTPISVTVSGQVSADALVEVTVLDGDGVPSRVEVPCPAGQPSEGSQQVIHLFAMIGRANSPVAVTIREAATVVAERTFMPGDDGYQEAISDSTELLLSVGPLLDWQSSTARSAGRSPLLNVELERVSNLPDAWWGYDAVNTLVVTTSDPAAALELAQNKQKLETIQEWVERGGRLIIVLGSQTEALLTGESMAAWNQLVPGQFAGMQPLAILSALEEYSESSMRLSDSGAESETVAVPRLESISGMVEASEADLALVIRSPRAFGQVICVCVDLDRPPFTEWKGQGPFLNKLIGRTAQTARADRDAGGAVSWLGLTDLSAQLRGALDQFPSLRVIPFWLVALLVGGYIAWIGPIDYFVLKRLFRRMELTWITLPAIILAVSVGAYLFAQREKGDFVRVNQVDLVDVDMASGLVRGSTWFNVFSPQTRAYTVNLEPMSLAPGEAERQLPERSEMLLSWFGLPGAALGGMSSPTASTTLWREPYQFSQKLDQLLGVPIPIWSSKSFTGRWSFHDELAAAGQLSAGIDEVPRGTLTNTWEVPLSDCLLAYGRWGLLINGTWKPGASIDIGSPTADLERTELTTRLTDRRMEYDESSKRFVRVALPYEQQSYDLWKILREMMFYDASGGATYAKLSNNFQHFVDLSGHLRAGRAILIGRGPARGARLSLDDAPPDEKSYRHEVFYRIVLPVDTLARGS